LCEYLTGVKPEKQRDVIASLSSRFVIHPFDVRCCSFAARLFSNGRSVVHPGKKGERVCLRADTMIVATAAVYGASVLYSADGRCRRLAPLVSPLRIEDLPSMPPDLFGYAGNGERPS